MVGIINSRNRCGTEDIEPSIEMYSSKLKDLGYSESQITSVIEKLRSSDPTLYPYLLGAVLYSVKTKLYQQMKVSELKQGLENILKESKSPNLRKLLYKFLDALDFIIDMYLKWESLYSNPHFKLDYQRLFGELAIKELHSYHYNTLPPSRVLEVFLKYLSKNHFLIANYLVREAMIKGTVLGIEDYNKIRSFEDNLRKIIEELKKYERENLPKLLNESVKRIIEIYGKLGPIIKEYSTYAKDIETQAIKSLNDLEDEYKKGKLSGDYYYKLRMTNKEKLHNAAEMCNYIKGILKMSYLIEINKVSIDEIMNLLNKTEDPLLNLKETYNLLLSEQSKLINCEIMKRDWCTRR